MNNVCNNRRRLSLNTGDFIELSICKIELNTVLGVVIEDNVVFADGTNCSIRFAEDNVLKCWRKGRVENFVQCNTFSPDWDFALVRPPKLENGNFVLIGNSLGIVGNGIIVYQDGDFDYVNEIKECTIMKVWKNCISFNEARDVEPTWSRQDYKDDEEGNNL